MRSILCCGVVGLLSASEGTAFRLLALPMPWQSPVVLEGSAEQGSSESVEGAGQVAIDRENLSSAVRLFADDQRTLLLDLAGGRIGLEADRPIQLPNSGNQLPTTLYSGSVGLSGRYIDSAQRRYVAAAGYGFSSDEPGENPHDTSWRVFAAVFLPTEQFNGWSLGLAWRSETSIPFPLFAYHWNPSRQLRTVLGLPYAAVFWDINEQWSFSARNFALNPGLQLDYRLAGPWRLHTRVAREGWSSHIASRSDADLELSLRAWTWGLGAAWKASQARNVVFEAGYSFARDLVESDSSRFFTTDTVSRLDLDDAWYARLSFTWNFATPAPQAPAAQR